VRATQLGELSAQHCRGFGHFVSAVRGGQKKGGLLSLSHRSKCLASKPRNRSITLSWKSSLPFSDMHLLWGPRLLVIVGHSWERKGEPLFWNWKGHPRLPQTMALLGEEGRKKQTLIKLNPVSGVPSCRDAMRVRSRSTDDTPTQSRAVTAAAIVGLPKLPTYLPTFVISSGALPFVATWSAATVRSGRPLRHRGNDRGRSIFMTATTPVLRPSGRATRRTIRIPHAHLPLVPWIHGDRAAAAMSGMAAAHRMPCTSAVTRPRPAAPAMPGTDGIRIRGASGSSQHSAPDEEIDEDGSIPTYDAPWVDDLVRAAEKDSRAPKAGKFAVDPSRQVRRVMHLAKHCQMLNNRFKQSDARDGSLQDDNEALQSNNRALQSDNKVFQSDNKALQSKNDVHWREIQSLKFRAQTRGTGEGMSRGTRVENPENQIKSLNTKLTRLVQSNSALAGEMEERRGAYLKEADELRATHDKKIKELKTTHQGLATVKDGLCEQVEKLTSVAAEKDREKAELLRNVETLRETNQGLTKEVERLTVAAAEKNTKMSELLCNAETLRSRNQELESDFDDLRGQFEKYLGELTNQKREFQELQGKHEVLVVRERELGDSLRVKDEEIETLKQQPGLLDEGNNGYPCPDSPLLGSGLPSPYIKSEGPNSEPHSSAGPEDLPDIMPDIVMGYAVQPEQVAALDLASEDYARLYTQLGCGVTKLFHSLFGMSLISEPISHTGQPDDVVVRYVAALGGLAKSPPRITKSITSSFWTMQEPWIKTTMIGLTPRSDVEERFMQLCFLISSIRKQDDDRSLPSVTDIVTSFLGADYSESPLAAAAFLETMASLPLPTSGGIFKAREVAVAIIICELCCRLEDVLPDVPRRIWTVGSILGPTVQAIAEMHPIGKLASAISNHDRLSTKSIVHELVVNCGEQFCFASTSAAREGHEDEIGLLYCGEGQGSFLMIDFGSRSFRLVECQLANWKPNPIEPRKLDLIVEKQGQELFRFPAAPMKISSFWLGYVMVDIE